MKSAPILLKITSSCYAEETLNCTQIKDGSQFLIQETFFGNLRSLPIKREELDAFMQKPNIHYFLHVKANLSRFGPFTCFNVQTGKLFLEDIRRSYKG